MLTTGSSSSQRSVLRASKESATLTIIQPLSLTNICIAAAAIAYGWGKPIAYLTPAEVVASLKLQFALQTVWIFTLCFVRLSIAASLLRFGQERWWKWTLWSIMGLQSLISSSYVVIQFGQCRPISYAWEQVGDVECWDINAIVDYGWAIACMIPCSDCKSLLLIPCSHICRNGPHSFPHAHQARPEPVPIHRREDTHRRPHVARSARNRHHLR